TAAGMLPDIERLLALNSRTPEHVLGDVRALVAGATVARRRLEALAEEYGRDGLARGIEDYLDYAERRMRASLTALPDGTYRGAYMIDSDGIESERAYRIAVAVTIAGDQARLDFEGTDPQVAASINSGLSQTLSGALFGLRCFLDPTIPMNEGCLRPVTFQ